MGPIQNLGGTTPVGYSIRRNQCPTPFNTNTKPTKRIEERGTTSLQPLKRHKTSRLFTGCDGKVVDRPVALDVPSLLNPLEYAFLTPIQLLIAPGKHSSQQKKGNLVRVDLPAIAMSAVKGTLVDQFREESRESHRLWL